MQNQTSLENGFQSKFSTETALVSFGIGTIFFVLLQLYPGNAKLLIYGFSFTVMAAIINGIIFINLLYCLLMQPNQREILAIKIMISLANIPVAIAYSYILFLSK